MPKKADLKKIWEKLEPGYYENSNLGQKMWQLWKFKAIKSVLPQKGMKALDIGCADGYFLSRIANLLLGTEVYGLDISEKLIRAGKSKYPGINFLVGDAHHLPFRNQEFDLVLCCETIEHLLSPEKVILEIKRVMRPDGKVIIELDSGNSLFRFVFWVWTKFFKGRIWQGAHLYSLNIKKLEKLFEKVGLKTEKKIISHLGMAVTFLCSKK